MRTAVRAMSDIVRTSIAPTRASMLLLMLFAAVAMTMAAVGVFGVMSYTVTLRAREMGIRLALGTRPSEVRRMDASITAIGGLGLAVFMLFAGGATRLAGLRFGGVLTLGLASWSYAR